MEGRCDALAHRHGHVSFDFRLQTSDFRLPDVQWLETLDIDLFRFLNAKLANPLFDAVMPFVSGNAFFYPLLLATGIGLIWKGRSRGLVCVLLLAFILPLGDSWVCRTIKMAVARPRPFVVLPAVHRPGVRDGDTGQPPPASTQKNETPAAASGSMPSSHAANWFAATMIAFIYYRRSLWFMLPGALLVGFSRIYNGVHYPTDVLAGAILGAGYAAAAVWSLDALWRWAGRKWFPLWWEKFPSLLNPTLQFGSQNAEGPELVARTAGSASGVTIRRPLGAASPQFKPAVSIPHSDVDAHWLRLGYVLVAVLLLARLAYIAGDTIQLTGDEAYQWLWSKHLALSYYSQPPLIAYVQFLSTAVFGDTAFGIRFFSPVCAALLSVILLRFFSRELNARAGFFLILIVTATPLLSAGAVLMTVDVFSALFWTAAMLAGWRAVQPAASTGSWLWVGLWMGLGLLSTCTTVLVQWLSWAVFFALWPPARRHLRRPGPYLALLISLLCALRFVIGIQQHHWTTAARMASDARIGEPWSPAVLDFFARAALWLNPAFFVAMVWAAIAFWRRNRHDPRLVYFFSMGGPLFLAYFLGSFDSRVELHWIAPSILPLFCLMVSYWDIQWRLGSRPLRAALIAGLALGLPAVVIGHSTELVGKFTGHLLPVNQDPLHRARGWREVARLAERARRELQAEGKPVFIIASDDRLAGELSFYLAEPRGGKSEAPLVYCLTTAAPMDQFYFWPGYSVRKGENAVFVLELDRDDPKPKPAPAQLRQEFDSVEDMGIREVLDHGRVLWRLQFFGCRGLR